MLQTSERETEILLGNKQLLGIFFVVAALLGIAFTGGYMVGRGASSKKPAAAVGPAEPANNQADTAQSSGAATRGGETHSVPADDGSSSTANNPSQNSTEVLGARRTPKQLKVDRFAPESGQEFLQVAAVPHDHAVAVAAVLRRKGFHAHTVSKPGDANTYRVIVGPIRDAGELASVRDSLRKTGFNQVIVQRY